MLINFIIFSTFKCGSVQTRILAPDCRQYPTLACFIALAPVRLMWLNLHFNKSLHEKEAMTTPWHVTDWMGFLFSRMPYFLLSRRLKLFSHRRRKITSQASLVGTHTGNFKIKNTNHTEIYTFYLNNFW